MCWPREIIPEVCDILQRPGIISLAAETPKGGAICVNVQQFLRLQIAVMVAGHEMREIIPGVCDILQRPGIISLAAETPKGGAICVSVQQLLRHPIAVMVAGHEMVHPVFFWLRNTFSQACHFFLIQAQI